MGGEFPFRVEITPRDVLRASVDVARGVGRYIFGYVELPQRGASTMLDGHLYRPVTDPYSDCLNEVELDPHSVMEGWIEPQQRLFEEL